MVGQPSRHPLDEYVVPIGSGLTPQRESEPGGVLNGERAAELGERLRQLHSARRVAEAECRTYTLTCW